MHKPGTSAKDLLGRWPLELACVCSSSVAARERTVTHNCVNKPELSLSPETDSASRRGPEEKCLLVLIVSEFTVPSGMLALFSLSSSLCCLWILRESLAVPGAGVRSLAVEARVALFPRVDISQFTAVCFAHSSSLHITIMVAMPCSSEQNHAFEEGRIFHHFIE
ncbi:hypothetical protein MHYP_G00320090 [Metynnis hypsauchen]